MNHVLVAFGSEILQIIPGRVSAEVDARLSFDTQATVKKHKKSQTYPSMTEALAVIVF